MKRRGVLTCIVLAAALIVLWVGFRRESSIPRGVIRFDASSDTAVPPKFTIAIWPTGQKALAYGGTPRLVLVQWGEWQVHEVGMYDNNGELAIFAASEFDAPTKDGDVQKLAGLATDVYRRRTGMEDYSVELSLASADNPLNRLHVRKDGGDDDYEYTVVHSNEGVTFVPQRWTQRTDQNSPAQSLAAWVNGWFLPVAVATVLCLVGIRIMA